MLPPVATAATPSRSRRRLLLGGAGLVVTAILYPDGIAGAVAARATALVPGRGPAGSPGVERPSPAGDAAVAAGSLK